MGNQHQSFVETTLSISKTLSSIIHLDTNLLFLGIFTHNAQCCAVLSLRSGCVRWTEAIDLGNEKSHQNVARLHA